MRNEVQAPHTLHEENLDVSRLPSFDAALESAQRLTQVSPLHQRFAEVAVCLGVARIEGQRAAVLSHCLSYFALILECSAEVVMGFGKVRLEGQRAAKMRHRRVRFSLIQERIAEVVVDLGEVRL